MYSTIHKLAMYIYINYMYIQVHVFMLLYIFQQSKGGVPMPEPPIKKVFIGGLSFDTEESDLKMFFEKYGKVSSMMRVLLSHL